MNIISRAIPLLLLSLGIATGTLAQQFPTRPVHIIVPYSAGSGSDVIARLLGPKLTEAWGQPVVVENREGAGGLIGAQAVAKSAPDGYTLLFAGIPWAVAPTLYSKPTYDVQRDFVAVARIGFIPSVLVVNPAMPVKDAKELLQLAQAKPGQLNYSSSGKGSPSQLFMEYLKAMAKVDIVDVPYKVTAQALTDVIGGQVTMNMPILVAALPHIRAGRLKALAVTSPNRSAAAPEIPTMAEAAGLPGYDATQWVGLVAPAGTPPDAIARINAELGRALQHPDVKERIANLGVDFAPATPEQFAADVRTDTAKWAALIKALDIRLD
jgi:tripartite-type tricarboxylate transporter receptor subunit TctC